MVQTALPQIRNTKNRSGVEPNTRKYNLRYEENISEVSPIIRCSIPRTAFWVDFLIPISPNLKKVFKTKGNASD